MWLKSIRLKNFKRLVDFQAQFGPGINVVKGPLNEMGKSTLLEGIIAALFHNPRSTAKWLKDYVSWGSSRQCQTSLEFANKGNRYLLEKDFEKGSVKLVDCSTREELDTFKEISEKMAELVGTNSDKLFSSTSCIRQDEVREVSSGKKEISESLEEAVTGGEESVLASQVIQKLDGKVSEMKKGLDRPVKFPGSLASLKSRFEAASQRYSEVESVVAEVEAEKLELVGIKKELAQIGEEYKRSKALLGKNKQRKEIEASIENLKQKYDEVDKQIDEINKLVARSKEATEAIKSIEGLENEQQVSRVGKGLNDVEIKRGTIAKDLPARKEELKGVESQVTELRASLEQAEQALGSLEGFESPQQVSELKRGLDIIRIRRGDIEKDLANRQGEVAEAKKKLNERKNLTVLGSKQSTASASVISVGGIVGVVLGPLYFLGLVVLGMTFLAVNMWARNALTRERSELAHGEERVQEMNDALDDLGREENGLLAGVKCSTVDDFSEKEKGLHRWSEERVKLESQQRLEQARASDLERRIRKMEEVLEEVDSQKKALLAEVKSSILEEFKEKEKSFHKWAEEKRNYENQLKGKLGSRVVEEIEGQRSETIRNLRVTEDRLTEDLIETRLSPEKYSELELKVESLEGRRAELESKERRCEAFIDVASFDAEDQIKLEEELEKLREDLQREERRVSVYELASEFMARARTEVFSSANEVLEKEIQSYLTVFTDGKYKQVSLSKEELEFWVYSDEKGDWAKPEELSGGVIDEFYLASRLALAKVIFHDKKPPLILDDPFVNFDQIRLAKTLDFFKKLAEDHQIIIFTLGDIYDEVADNIIVL